MKDFFIHQDRNHHLTVGGVVSLSDFASDEIVVRVKGGFITVKGSKLVIQRFDENEIIIVGKIGEVITNVAN